MSDSNLTKVCFRCHGTPLIEEFDLEELEVSDRGDFPEFKVLCATGSRIRTVQTKWSRPALDVVVNWWATGGQLLPMDDATAFELLSLAKTGTIGDHDHTAWRSIRAMVQNVLLERMTTENVVDYYDKAVERDAIGLLDAGRKRIKHFEQELASEMEMLSQAGQANYFEWNNPTRRRRSEPNPQGGIPEVLEGDE
ncbi:hypothetical protein HDE_08268 [Halotydeus destructor]|nr:hypothetical protein HDE_08268 [Halotydeus destructor]